MSGETALTVKILAGIGKAMDLLQKLRTGAEKIKEADVQLVIADLTLALSDLKLQIAALQDENFRLRKEINTIHETGDLRSRLSVRDGMYFLAEPPKGRTEGPYCTNCFDTGSVLTLLRTATTGEEVFGSHYCPSCHNHFGPEKPYLGCG